MAKPQKPEFITLAVAAFIVAALNGPFWSRLIHAVQPAEVSDWLFIGSVGVALTIVIYLFLLLFSLRPVFRVLVAVLLPLAAALSYFMHEYGVVIDANMVRNVLETDTREAGDLVTLGAAAFVLMLGVLPAIVVWRLKWVERPFIPDAVIKLKAAAIALPVLVAAVFPFSGEYLSLFRESRELRLSLAPSNAIAAVVKYVRKKQHIAPTDVAARGTDAKRFEEPEARPHIFVVVVGETARADHFGLNGYTRQTTPKLAKIAGLVNYKHATSCGTDTAQSVPCMFSGLRREDFTNEKAEAQENLLDALKHAGTDVLWRENQSGCKGVCDRIATETLTGETVETHDDVLVDGLKERLAQTKRDTVIVLHMMGSHGPAYSKRYPPEFETFKPVCRESQFSRCRSDEIINAYDNTILYSDHVLARLIGVLDEASKSGLDTGMLYVSDHGESLGEGNIYLHGMPYAIAPAAQTHVPMVAWLSQGLKDDNSIADGCLERQAEMPVSHDNLFHTVLGIMDVETKLYDPRLDLFASCTHHQFSSSK